MTYPNHSINVELQRRELDRIAKSQHFARAVKLRQLVQWLGERSVSGVSEKPSEYVVGIEALGKPSDFDPSYDVSVRQLKRRMCARLAKYYCLEGRDSRVRLVCDRGFAVRFETVPFVPSALPRLLVMPLRGDESSLFTGLLSHGLMETGRVQVVSRSAQREDHGADFLTEGEVLHHSDGSWSLSLRLVDAVNGHVLSGLRREGPGNTGRTQLRDAAEQLVVPIPSPHSSLAG